MNGERKKRLPLMVVGCAGALLLGGFLYFQFRPEVYVREIEGTIVFLDAAARRAALETIDPANGAAMEFAGEIPVGCPVTLNGSAVVLSDLRVGDRARVKGRLRLGERQPNGKREKQVTAEWIHAQRIPGAGS